LLTLEQIPERVEQILSDQFASAIIVESLQVLSAEHRRNRIMRISIQDSTGQLPGTLIIKQPVGENYDPEDVYAQETVKHFNDRAAIEFLTNLSLNADTLIAPIYFGGHIDLGYIMEDLGSHKQSILIKDNKSEVDASLMGPLLNKSSQKAVEALSLWIECLAKMHSSTIGKEEEYNAIRRRLGSRKESSRVFIANWFRDNISTILNAFQKINFSPDANFYEELMVLANIIENPGPFLCYTHGDPCPDNCSYVDGNFRLIDFEIGSFQHALFDAVYAHMAFPTCGCCGTLPMNIVNELETLYREKLVEGCPEASDDRIFRMGIMDACAFRAMTTLMGLAVNIEEDHNWGMASQRQRILTRVEIMGNFESADNHLQSVVNTCARLASKLRKLWPDISELPAFPAFQNG